MSADDNAPDQPAETTGMQMARAREAAGMDLPALAAKTRIRVDHLKSLEEGNLASLPGRTYVFGFARSYARAVGMDETRLLEAIRQDYGDVVAEAEEPATQAFSPGDPARAPSSRFAWIAGGAALVAVAGGAAIKHDWSGTLGQLPSLLPHEAPAPKSAASGAPAMAQAPAAGGAVVFTAQADKLWVKFYDSSGKQLMQKLMAKGETYTVPADAQGPEIWTGRPDALTITVGGHPVAKLSDENKKIKDVPVDAASLLKRPGLTAPMPVPAASAAPMTAQPHPGAPNAAASQPAGAQPMPAATHTPSAAHHSAPHHQPAPHHVAHHTEAVPGEAGEVVHGASAPAAAPADTTPKPSLNMP